jgi:hypothetical protein
LNAYAAGGSGGGRRGGRRGHRGGAWSDDDTLAFALDVDPNAPGAASADDDTTDSDDSAGYDLRLPQRPKPSATAATKKKQHKIAPLPSAPTSTFLTTVDDGADLGAGNNVDGEGDEDDDDPAVGQLSPAERFARDQRRRIARWRRRRAYFRQVHDEQCAREATEAACRAEFECAARLARDDARYNGIAMDGSPMDGYTTAASTIYAAAAFGSSVAMSAAAASGGTEAAAAQAAARSAGGPTVGILSDGSGGGGAVYDRLVLKPALTGAGDIAGGRFGTSGPTQRHVQSAVIGTGSRSGALGGGGGGVGGGTSSMAGAYSYVGDAAVLSAGLPHFYKPQPVQFYGRGALPEYKIRSIRGCAHAKLATAGASYGAAPVSGI